MKEEKVIPEIPSRDCEHCAEGRFQLVVCCVPDEEDHYKMFCPSCEYEEPVRQEVIKWFSEREVEDAIAQERRRTKGAINYLRKVGKVEQRDTAERRIMKLTLDAMEKELGARASGEEEEKKGGS